jgi:hypothetical protein
MEVYLYTHIHAFVTCNGTNLRLPLPLHFTYYNFKISVQDRPEY